MPKVIGEAGRYATERSVSTFQRLIMTTMLVVCAVGFFEGAILTSLFVRVRLDPVVALILELAGGMAIWRLCQAQSQRIDRYERERQNWRSGAEGERSVARALDLLPPEFVVFHDFNTVRGNFDHLVIGPTGIFAIETKNFRGTIGAAESGELTLNGEPSATPYVRQLTARIMAMREKVVALSGREVFIKGLMVFPKARVGREVWHDALGLLSARRAGVRTHREREIQPEADAGRDRAFHPRLPGDRGNGRGLPRRGLAAEAGGFAADTAAATE